MIRPAAQNDDDRALIEKAKKLYFATENPLTLAAIGDACGGRSLGWVQHLARRECWPARGSQATAKTATLYVTTVDRKLHGPLADDVVFLRNKGHTVARFKGDYRIDDDIVSLVELRQRASELRVKAKSAAPVSAPSPSIDKAAKPAPTPAPAPAPVAAKPFAPEKAAQATRASNKPRSAMAAYAVEAPPWNKAALAELRDVAAHAAKLLAPDPLVARIDAIEKQNEALARRLGATERALAFLINMNRETFQTHAQRMAELDKELGRL